MPNNIPPHLQQAARHRRKKNTGQEGEFRILPYPDPENPRLPFPRKPRPGKYIPGVDPRDPTRGRGTIPSPPYTTPGTREGQLTGAGKRGRLTKPIPGVDPKDPTRGRGTIPSPTVPPPRKKKGYGGYNPPLPDRGKFPRGPKPKVPTPTPTKPKPPSPEKIEKVKRNRMGRVKVSQSMVDTLNKNGMQRNIELWRQGGQSAEFNEAFRRFYPRIAGGQGRSQGRGRVSRGRGNNVAEVRERFDDIGNSGQPPKMRKRPAMTAQERELRQRLKKAAQNRTKRGRASGRLKERKRLPGGSSTISSLPPYRLPGRRGGF